MNTFDITALRATTEQRNSQFYQEAWSASIVSLANRRQVGFIRQTLGNWFLVWGRKLISEPANS